MPNPTPPGASLPPPPPTSGNTLKYVVVGLIFLGTAVGLWLYSGSQKAPPPPPSKPPEVARVNPMDQQQLELEEQPPEPPPAAGEPAPAPVKQPRKGSGNEWECSGDLVGAKKVIDANYAQIRSCYERRLKVNNILQGDVKLKVKVGAGGKVVAAAVSGSIKDQEVFNCVRSLAQSWTFAAPTGGACAVVQVPFAFAPKDG